MNLHDTNDNDRAQMNLRDNDRAQMNLRDINKPIRRGLGRLRRRARSLLGVLGASRTLVWMLAALLAFFCADYALRLPIDVRRIITFGIVAGLGVLVYRHVVRPLSRDMSDEMLAARVEAAHPGLDNRISSSLSFAGAVDDPENEDSPELMRAVVEETAGLARDIRFVDVARSGPTVRWSGAAAGLLLAVAIAAVANADVVTTFIQRSLLLKDIAWPRRTTLTVNGMRPGMARRVTRGRDTVIEVAAEGSIPRPRRVLVLGTGRPQGDARGDRAHADRR